MSSHREAPEISKDPVADGTDTYAFISPEDPTKVILIANFIPLQKPDSGPNFFEFGDDVLYEINISNRPGSKADITYQFRFETKVRNPKTFLYNTGPITSLTSTAWNRPQTYSVLRRKDGKSAFLAKGLPTPPVNVGPRSTPDYAKLANSAISDLPGGARVFAGQRADAFWVDLGSIFDLGGLRPLNQAHLIKLATMDGINSVQSFNVHTIALEVPITDLTRDGGKPTNPESSASTIGVWATASRRATRTFDEATGKFVGIGPWKQVSRLANPLFNEVIVPMAEKDRWNASEPAGDATYAKYVARPELAGLLPVLYPGAFPNLAAYDKDRADLDAILLTGIPKGIVPGFANYTGRTKADVLRLNLAIPPAEEPNALGVVGGDLAGFPNGRRLTDDVTTIALRAVAGATIPLVDSSYKVDDAVGLVSDGSSYTNSPLLTKFPFLGHPGGGYETTPGTTSTELNEG
ncbi:DUF4331 domain-containing protein [Nocardioides sp. TRM66260-LWL]|uniref:DUF4331 domain-containing protein n=1 Tax=Nocardioides sp. TRM66260-LWL TaxID=2874478 RepID=UPI001CC51F6A|nr:DUF4331 domain-containing protein [Nocardioides sp. TRM66260-LWL]MBZ5736453.1 DUF4331 domain-containing protein [Nocardioides sp. TRM66260-LWL]